MNIIFHTPNYLPNIGGAESLMSDVTSILAQKGNNVTIVATREPPQKSLPITAPGREVSGGVEILRLKYIQEVYLLHDLTHAPRGPLNLTWQHLKRLVEYHSIIKNRKVDVVCIGLFGYESMYLLLLKHIMGFKMIVYSHGEIRAHRKRKGLNLHNLLKAFTDAERIIVVSERLREEITQLLPGTKGKIVVIPNGVDIARIRQSKPFERPRGYALFVGRLHEVKSIDTLILAFSRIAKDAPNLDLLIVGVGAQESHLKESALSLGLGERVVFLGWRGRQDVFSLIRGCVYLVLPSLAEAHPIVVLESLAAGKMVIGSRVKGIEDIVKDGENGALFPPKDDAQLASLMLKYYLDKGARKNMEERIKASDLSAYDIREVAEKHLAVIYSVAKGKTSGR